MKRMIARLDDIDWTNLAQAETVAGAFLAELAATPGLLRDAFAAVRADPVLAAKCEHYPEIFDKVVLWSSPSGVRVRLHVFLPKYSEDPHDHRWPFAARVVRGAYRHELFARLAAESVDQVALLRSAGSRVEHPGSGYLLGPDAVHQVVPIAADTVSLVVRGPSVKGSYSVFPKSGDLPTSRLGAQAETAAEGLAKQMSSARLDLVESALTRMGIL